MSTVVYNRSNMLTMAEYPDAFFDQANDDPPYFDGPNRKSYYGHKVSPIGVQRVYRKTQQWQLPDERYFAEVKRVSKEQIIWGANYYDFIGPVHKTPRREELEEWMADHPVGWIVWDKRNDSSFFNTFELAWTSYSWPTKIFEFMWNGMLQGSGIETGRIMRGNKKLNQKRIHPTEKPYELYKWCNLITQPKNIISNYVGSGSDRIVADRMGIDFVGSEIDPLHFANQEHRYDQYLNANRIFQHD